MKKWIGLFWVLICLAAVLLAEEPQELTLQDCIQIAIKNNYSVINARNNLASADQGVRIAKAAWYPQVGAGMGFTRSSSLLRFGPATLETDETWYTSGIQIRQSIFEGWKNSAFLSQAKAIHETQQASYQMAKQRIIQRVKQYYFNCLKAEHLFKVSEEALSLSEEQLKRAQSRFEVGKVPRSDVLSAQVEKARYRSGLIEAKNQVNLSRARLNYILGLDVSSPVKLKNELGVEPKQFNPEEVLTQAFQNRPDLKQAELAVQSEKAGLVRSRSARYPSLSSNFSYGFRADTLTNMFNNRSWNLGLSFSIPLFDGFTTSSNIQQSRLDLSSAEQSLRDKKLEVALNVEQNLLNFKEAEERIRVAVEEVALADENLRMAQELYNQGGGTMLGVQDAQVKYSDAKRAQVEAQYDYQLALANLDFAIYGGSPGSS